MVQLHDVPLLQILYSMAGLRCATVVDGFTNVSYDFLVEASIFWRGQVILIPSKMTVLRGHEQIHQQKGMYEDIQI